LTTNIPHPIMAYSNFPFPPSTPVFPKAAVVQTYLETYCTHHNLSPYIRLNTTVTNAEWLHDASQWKVSLSTNETLSFDFLVVANGHYRVPIYPEIPGLAQWLKAGKASHSAWYRRPHNMGSVVLVVGAGPSGRDISAEMRDRAHTVIHSISAAKPLDIGNLKIRGRVVEFKNDRGQVIFEDGSMESGIEHCILATGYSLSFPFLPASVITQPHTFPPPVPPLPKELYNSGYHVFPLAKHLFPLLPPPQPPATSIAFMGLLVKVVPFPLFECMAHAIVKVISSPSSLNTNLESLAIITRYESLRTKYSDDTLAIAKAWHKARGHEQFEYRDQLCVFAGIDGEVRVEEWEKEMYDEKVGLRIVWRELEESGEAEEWVRDVGEGGQEEWVQLMKRLLRRWRERDPTVELRP
jgi:Flavin-binding monooxygenase-like